MIIKTLNRYRLHDIWCTPRFKLRMRRAICLKGAIQNPNIYRWVYCKKITCLLVYSYSWLFRQHPVVMLSSVELHQVINVSDTDCLIVLCWGCRSRRPGSQSPPPTRERRVRTGCWGSSRRSCWLRWFWRWPWRWPWARVSWERGASPGEVWTECTASSLRGSLSSEWCI